MDLDDAVKVALLILIITLAIFVHDAGKVIVYQGKECSHEYK